MSSACVPSLSNFHHVGFCNRTRRLPLAVAKEPWSAAAPKHASVADEGPETPWRVEAPCGSRENTWEHVSQKMVIRIRKVVFAKKMCVFVPILFDSEF